MSSMLNAGVIEAQEEPTFLLLNHGRALAAIEGLDRRQPSGSATTSSRNRTIGDRAGNRKTT
jgi:hypothetical protein